MSKLVPDKLALEELRASGVGVSKPVELVHYLYCDKRCDADRVRSLMTVERFRVVVRRGALGDNWLVLSSRTQMLSEDTIVEMRSFFEGIALSVSGGEYDGWEVAVDDQ